MTEKLKPCPWCGLDENLYVDSDSFGASYVSCTSCSVDGPFRDSREQAVLEWNSRTLDQETMNVLVKQESIVSSVPQNFYTMAYDRCIDEDHDLADECGAPCDECVNYIATLEKAIARQETLETCAKVVDRYSQKLEEGSGPHEVPWTMTAEIASEIRALKGRS